MRHGAGITVCALLTILPLSWTLAACPAAAQIGRGEQSAPATTESSRLPWPTTCQEAIDRLVQGLDEPSKQRLRETPRDDLIRYHLGWGTGIRNGYGMWKGNDALVDSCVARRAGTQHHPDEASMIIMEGVWEALQRRQ